MPASGNGGGDAAARERRVVADASPLIGLAAAGGFDLLRRLFRTVLVARAVVDEIAARAERPGAGELDGAMRAGWIRVAPTPMAAWRLAGVDAGEAATIALARELGGTTLVLMDDAIGRQRAVAEGLEVLDVAGVLLAAKRAGFVDAVRPYLDELSRKGFTIPDAIAAAALEAAGEPPGA